MRSLTLLAVLALIVPLAGCGPESRHAPIDAPTQAEAPVFADADEALAAAEEVYRQYLDVSARITEDLVADPGQLVPFVTPSRLDTE